MSTIQKIDLYRLHAAEGLSPDMAPKRLRQALTKEILRLDGEQSGGEPVHDDVFQMFRLSRLILGSPLRKARYDEILADPNINLDEAVLMHLIDDVPMEIPERINFYDAYGLDPATGNWKLGHQMGVLRNEMAMLGAKGHYYQFEIELADLAARVLRGGHNRKRYDALLAESDDGKVAVSDVEAILDWRTYLGGTKAGRNVAVGVSIFALLILVMTLVGCSTDTEVSGTASTGNQDTSAAAPTPERLTLGDAAYSRDGKPNLTSVNPSGGLAVVSGFDLTDTVTALGYDLELAREKTGLNGYLLKDVSLDIMEDGLARVVWREIGTGMVASQRYKVMLDVSGDQPRVVSSEKVVGDLAEADIEGEGAAVRPADADDWPVGVVTTAGTKILSIVYEPSHERYLTLVAGSMELYTTEVVPME